MKSRENNYRMESKDFIRASFEEAPPEGQMLIIDIVKEIIEELKGLANNGGHSSKKSSKSLDT